MSERRIPIDLLIRQDGSKVIDLTTQDSFKTTIITDTGTFTITYEKRSEENAE